jgi:hypothetical protein
MQVDTQNGLLDSMERAVAEKMHTGQADEALYGFAARLANATPPVDENFQRKLRARILTELTKDEKRSHQDRVQTVKRWRLSLAGVAVVLVLVFAAFQYIRVKEPEARVDTPATAPTLPLAAGDVDALVDKLNADPGSRTVVVFPADYAGTLAGRIQQPVVPLEIKGGLAPAMIQTALGAALPSSGLVDVILVNQDADEPLRRALEQRLYRLYRPGETGVEVFGALERNKFVAGPRDAAMEPIGVVFVGGVELVAAGVLDDLEPGNSLRLAFDWRVTEPVDDSLVMFVHLVHDGGQLVAQRDAIPGNGLLPVESWEPGELVRDQFALLLPAELPAGEYELLVGTYRAPNGMRYRLVEPERGVQGGTCVVVERFRVAE